MPAAGARWVRPLLIMGLVVVPLAMLVVARLFIMQPFYVPTGGMQPTLMGEPRQPGGPPLMGEPGQPGRSPRRGDHLLVEKVTFRFRAPARGDIVVFRTRGIVHSMVPQDQFFVQRVVGVPGDQVQIRNTGLYINSQLLTNPPIFATIQARTNGYCGYHPAELTANDAVVKLGEQQYFVAGDNSLNSLDSRYFGPIRREQVFGRPLFVYWPPHRVGFPE